MTTFLKKVKKEEIITFLILLLIAIFICNNFVYFHKVTDTYNVLEAGYEEYSNKFLKDGRVISFIALRIGNLLQIPIEIFITIMGILAIIIQTFSAYLLYKFLKNNYINLEGKRKYILLAGCFLVIFNPFAIEHLAYTESAIMTLGTLFSVIAAIQLTKKKTKNILFAILLTILSVISYQGIINIFITLSILFLILETKITKKEVIKRTGLILICTFIALMCCYLVINFGNIIFDSQRIEKRLLLNADFIKERIMLAIVTLPKIILSVITKSFRLLPQNTLLISIIATLIYILFHEKFNIHSKKQTLKNGKTKTFCNFENGWKSTGKYIILITIAIISAILPIFLLKTPSIEARISSSIGAILGLNIIYIISLGLKSKKIEIILPIFVIICVFINVYQYNTIGRMSHITNEIDEYVSLQIGDIITEYEEKNNITVENICIYYDNNITRTYLGMKVNTYTDRGLAISYCIKDCIQYYTNREFKEKTTEKEVYKKHFKNKNWNSFQQEQIVFKEDTMHICVY